MKKYILFVSALIALHSNCILAQNAINGFSQFAYSKHNFSIPKIRFIFQPGEEVGLWKSIINHKTSLDIVYNDNQSGINLVNSFVSIGFPKKYLPHIQIGRIFNSALFQFPSPSELPAFCYPSAAFIIPCDIGVAVNYNTDRAFFSACAINGNGALVDNNQSLDASSRVSHKLPWGFIAGAIYQYGKQPDGPRKITGVDLTWQKKGLWINGGQNIFDYHQCKIGRWLWATLDITAQLQLVGLVESLKTDKTNTGLSAGFNIILSKQTIVRSHYYKLAADNSRGWSILLQRGF